MTAAILTESELRAAIEREMPGVRADLERLVRIPGIAFDGFDHSATSSAPPRRSPSCCAAVASTSRSCAPAASPR